MSLDNFDKMVLSLGNFNADNVGMPIQTDGGVYQIVCSSIDGASAADYGGGTLTFETSFAGGGWQPAYFDDGTLIEINAANDFVSTIRLNKQLKIRVTLADSTSPDLSVKLV